METDGAITFLIAFAGGIASGFEARLNALGHLNADIAAMRDGFAATGWQAGAFLLTCALIALLAAAVQRVAQGAFVRNAAPSSPKAVGAWLGATLLAIFAGALVSVAIAPPGAIRRCLLTFAVLVPITVAVRVLVEATVPDFGARRAPSFMALLRLALTWGMGAAALLSVMRQLAAGPSLLDLVATLGGALPVTVLLCLAYLRARAPIALSIARRTGGSRLLRGIGLRWPAIAIGVIIGAFLLGQIVISGGQTMPFAAAATSLVLVLLSPHLDQAISRWATTGLNTAAVPLGVVAFRRTLRLAAFTFILTLALAVWGAPLFALAGVTVNFAARIVVEIGTVALVTAYFWNLIGVATDRILEGEGDVSTAPRSRLGTVLPLAGATLKIALLALTVLTVLLLIGVNVWPLVTGLSVFGLAIGFGSQTLVKDVVSGLFFLFDDAFRMGEYIETGGAKGTVERISIRSLSLRHPRGAVATVPYGQISKVNNHSRDWVIEKLSFRVPFHTDMEVVRKSFKRIGQEIMQDPVLKEDIIETFKSQGIAEMEDGTLLIRGKFKARAGRQFAARKAVLVAVQKVFREQGIEAMQRPLVRPQVTQ